MKDLKISTELISSVLAKETRHLTYDTIYVEDNFIIFSYEGEYQFEVNIYEFAFKCKEWAYRNNFDIWSITWGAVEFQNNMKANSDERINANTEVEAIIKTCELILNDKRK